MIVDKIDFDLLIILLFFFIVIGGLILPILFFKFRKKLSLKWMWMLFKWKLPFYMLGLIILFVVTAYVIYANSTPKIIETFPLASANWDTYRNPVEIKFNVPVVVDKLDPKINPRIEGEWIWDSYAGSNQITRSGRFVPAETYFADQRVVVYIIGVSRALRDENHEMGVDFQSIKNPEIIMYSPNHGDDAVVKDQSIELTLSNENDHAIEYSFTIQPQLELEVSDIFSSKITLKPKTPFTQNTDYELTILKRPIRYSFKENKVIEYGEESETETLKFKTVKAPFIDDFKPKGTSVKSDATIRIKFSSTMDKQMVEDQLKIEPQIEGTFEWVDDLNVTFTPVQELEKETDFKVTFPAGLKNLQGGMFEEDVSFEFSTIGKVKVLSIQPFDNSSSITEDSNVYIKFDQEVDKQSAEHHFRMEPMPTGEFKWEENTLVFDPFSAMPYSTTYTVKMLAGVKSLYGKDMETEFKSTFTIRSDQVVIGGIPNLYQPQPSFSCNIYAALMVLNWKGHYPSVTDLIGEIGYNANQSNGIWSGNPYKEFVGNADGSWGYGVYWGPIQRVLANRGVNTDLHEGWNLAGVAKSITEGKPVIIWRYNGESADYDKDWVAADGTYVNGINGQHGGVITGFRGDVNNPSQIYLEDSWYGPGWYNASYIDYVWSRLGRVALVVK